MWSKQNTENSNQAWKQYAQQATPLKATTRTQWESIAQKQAVAWFHFVYPRYFKLFYHIPNEGKRPIALGKHLKAMGMKKGMLDLHLDVPHKAKNGTFYYGLRIEVKPADKDCQSWVSPEQEETIKEMNQQGYFATVCRGFDEIKDVVQWYLA